jgi:hypothetical protein
VTNEEMCTAIITWSTVGALTVEHVYDGAPLVVPFQGSRV